MSTPPYQVEVDCPECGTRFKDVLRDSINLSLGEEWTDEEIEEATTVRCPECGWQGDSDSIIVSFDD